MNRKKAVLSLERATDFMWRNARLLERAIFARAFLDGPPGAVTAVLGAYRNPDGGFGNALEPDMRAPCSTPLACEVALRALREAEIRDPALAAGMCKFLASVAEPNGRVEIASPDILDYPRAAHWNSPSFGTDSPNPTAGVVGLLHYQGADHRWLARASKWCWQRIERPLADAHEIATVLRFLEYAPERAARARWRLVWPQRRRTANGSSRKPVRRTTASRRCGSARLRLRSRIPRLRMI